MNKKLTANEKIDQVASTVSELSSTVDQLAIAVKNGFDELRTEMREGFRETNSRLKNVELRLDTIEKNTNGHENRISNLEDSMRVIKTKLDIK